MSGPLAFVAPKDGVADRVHFMRHAATVMRWDFVVTMVLLAIVMSWQLFRTGRRIWAACHDARDARKHVPLYDGMVTDSTEWVEARRFQSAKRPQLVKPLGVGGMSPRQEEVDAFLGDELALSQELEHFVTEEQFGLMGVDLLRCQVARPFDR